MVFDAFELRQIPDVRKGLRGPNLSSLSHPPPPRTMTTDDENNWALSSDESELTELSSDEDETPTAPAPVPAPPKPPPRRSTRAQNTKEYRVRATTGFFPTKHPLKLLCLD